MVRMLHPSFEKGLRAGAPDFPGGVLSCRCADKPVKVEISGAIEHNHACGCTKCWKPDGAAFSVVAVASTDKVSVTENGEKLHLIDPGALIQRYACRECGTHMHGPVEREHAFQGLTFVHPELFERDDWAAPGFAAFVSSVIEAGVDPEEMGAIRSALRDIGLETYDCLSPPLMDYLATWAARKSGKLS
jgi:S-(hydroxymethyl)glutathione synthase